MSTDTLDIFILTSDDILKIHAYLVKYFACNGDDPIEPPGLRDRHLLDSAVSRKTAGAFGRIKHPDALDNSITLLYGICHNHPFHNGNKRTAVVAMLVHLYKNHYTFRGMDSGILFNLVLELASHTLGKREYSASKGPKGSSRRKAIDMKIDRVSKKLSADEEISILSANLAPHLTRINRGHPVITTRSLKNKLQSFGFTFGEQKGNRIELIRTENKTTRAGVFRSSKTITTKRRVAWIPDPGSPRIVSHDEVDRIRKAAGLTESDGYDSTAFYDGADPIDEIIISHAMILKKLADYDKQMDKILSPERTLRHAHNNFGNH